MGHYCSIDSTQDKLYSVFASSASSQAASEAVNVCDSRRGASLPCLPSMLWQRLALLSQLNPLGYGQSRIERVDVVDLIQTEDELFDKVRIGAAFRGSFTAHKQLYVADSHGAHISLRRDATPHTNR